MQEFVTNFLFIRERQKKKYVSEKQIYVISNTFTTTSLGWIDDHNVMQVSNCLSFSTVSLYNEWNNVSVISPFFLAVRVYKKEQVAVKGNIYHKRTFWTTLYCTISNSNLLFRLKGEKSSFLFDLAY